MKFNGPPLSFIESVVGFFHHSYRLWQKLKRYPLLMKMIYQLLKQEKSELGIVGLSMHEKEEELQQRYR